MEKTLYLIIIFLICIGCKTQKEIQYIYKSSTDTFYQNKIQYDSVYLEKLIYREGDTVYKIVYDYKYKYLKDTVYSIEKDSAYIDKEIVKEVQVKSSFQKVQSWWFWISIIVFLIILALYIYNKVR